MTGPTTATAPPSRVGALITHAALVAVGLIAVTAVARFGVVLDVSWAGIGDTSGFRSFLLAAVWIAMIVAAVAFIRRLPDTALHRWMPVAPLLLLVAVRAALIPLVGTPLPADNDPGFLHELAVGVLDGGNPLVAHRPMGFSTMLGGLYAVFGVHPWLGELLNLALALLTGWMLHRFVLITWGQRPAAAALIVYALIPSQVLLVTTLYTETAYAAFLMTAIALAAGAVATQWVVLALAAGAVLALSQYVRPVSQAFLPVFVAVPFVSGIRASRAAILAAAIGVSFLAVLVPIAVHNLSVHGDLSLSTSSYGGWSVFVGANQEYDGRFNREDQAILRETEGASVWERSEILGRAGIERITADPRGFVELAVRKFRVLWSDDTYAVDAALPDLEATDLLSSAVLLASQGVYAGLCVAATIGLWRQRRLAAPGTVLVAGVIISVVAAHTVVEVQPRYHAYVLPLLCALAATVLAGAGLPRSVPEPEAAGA